MGDKVVVAGAGFSGISSALALSGKGYDVEVIDQNGYHLYTPAIPEFIGGELSGEDLRLNLSDFFSDTSIDFCREKIVGFDPESNVVETSSGAHSYDDLVLALGYDVNSYGIDISEAHTAYRLGDSEDVVEKAEGSESAIIIGCGYVGVEVASELERKGLDIRIVDQATRPMKRSSEKVSDKVLEYLNSRGIDFMGNKTVEKVGSERILFDNGEEISADMVLWLGGMQASRLVQRDFDCDWSGIDVNSGLSSLGFEDVFVAGPCADIEGSMTAHNSIIQGEIVAENIDRDDSQSLKEFEAGRRMLVLKMGKQAIFEFGDMAFGGRIFRYLKSLIRYRYRAQLRWKKLKL